MMILCVCFFLVFCSFTRAGGISDDEPTKVRLSFGKEATRSMTISWESLQFDVVSIGNERVVSTLSNFTQRTVPRDADNFVTYSSGPVRHATFLNLEPSTNYSYEFSSSVSSAVSMSSNYVFTTPSNGFPITFSVIGDLGQTSDSLSTLQHLDSHAPSFILHAGDMSYADCDGPRWDSYFSDTSLYSIKYPWMVCAGNHEIEPDNITGEVMIPYKNFFRMPWTIPYEDTTNYFQVPMNKGLDCTPSAFTSGFDFGNSFYSFTIENLVHVVVLNSYTNTDASSNQYVWLRDELSENVNRTRTPWLLVMFHSPWYNSNVAHQNESNTLEMRDNMESLLVQYHVNMVFSGHVHAYERSHPVAFGDVDEKSGVTYLNIGDGGNREGHAMTYMSPQPKSSAYRNGTNYGHGRVVL